MDYYCIASFLDVSDASSWMRTCKEFRDILEKLIQYGKMNHWIKCLRKYPRYQYIPLIFIRGPQIRQIFGYFFQEAAFRRRCIRDFIGHNIISFVNEHKKIIDSPPKFTPMQTMICWIEIGEFLYDRLCNCCHSRELEILCEKYYNYRTPKSLRFVIKTIKINTIIIEYRRIHKNVYL
jgi:hypothetical protein